MFRVVLLFCAVLSLTKSHFTEVSQCHMSSSGPLPIYTYISGCETQPCRLVQGQDVVTQIIFRAPNAIQRMRSMVWIYLSPIIGIPVDLGETCNYLSNKQCPVEENDILLYTHRLHIGDLIPVGTQMPIEFRIQDRDNNNNIVCFRVQAVILPPVNKLGAQNSTISAEV